MEREQIKTLLQILDTAYPTNKLEKNKATIDLWELMFKEYKADVVFTATKHYITSHKFFPAIAELRAEVEKFRVMSNEPKAIAAVSRADQADTESDGCKYCPYHDVCLGIKCNL